MLYLINYRAGYISDNNKHRICSKVNNDKIWHEWISLVMLDTCMVYPSCSWMTTYRNVASTVTHVLEFTEEYLTVFWTNVHALLCVNFGLLGTWAKMTRSHWSYIQTYTFSKWHLTMGAGNMCHILYVSWYDTVFSKDFQLFNSTNFKKNPIINLQTCSVQSCHHRHWRALFSTSAILKTAIFRKIKRRYWYLWYGYPQWTVHFSV